MVVNKKYYVIIENDFPLNFYMGGGNFSENFDDAYLATKEECEYELSTFDEPDEYKVIEVDASYTF